jgi:hypothetical protein
MTGETQRRPQPGEVVTVGDNPTRFAVIDFDGATYLLESEHGARCRAGVRMVRLVPVVEDSAA